MDKVKIMTIGSGFARQQAGAGVTIILMKGREARMRNVVRKAGNVTKLGYALPFVSAGFAMTLGIVTSSAYAAETFAPAGAKATLSVDYIYESASKKPNPGMYDTHWRVTRSANVVAQLTAQAPTAMPTVQAIAASQTAELEGQQAKAQSMATEAAPMMADVQKIMAKCGGDFDCIARETQAAGAAMQGTPQAAKIAKMKKEGEELGKPGAARYQAWRATAQKGSYVIDETTHIVNDDPLCVGRPHHLCTRDEIRKGSGPIPQPDAKKDPSAAAGVSAAEVDISKNTLTLRLPAPLLPLPYIETITSDELYVAGEDIGDRELANQGPKKKGLNFRVTAAEYGNTFQELFTVALKGGWRNQSGQQVINLKGKLGDAGTLTTRWRFDVQ